MSTATHPSPSKPRITIEEYEALTLAKGDHPDRSNGLCSMEAAAWLAGETHTDHPACVSPIIAAFVRRWNDDLDDDARNRLIKPLVPKILNTAGDAKLETRREWMIRDWQIRVYTPAMLRLAKIDVEAKSLAELPEVVDTESLNAAVKALTPARTKAAAAWDAAWAAAWDAAGDAAGAAAGDAAWAAAAGAAAWAAAGAAAGAAAWAAAGAAAWVAAGDAAWVAARAAAWAAAGAALKPTVTDLQVSAVELLERLIAVA
jgi:hypothetical protein